MAGRLLPLGSDLCEELLGRIIQLPETLRDRLSRAIVRGVPMPPFPVLSPGTGGLLPAAPVPTSLFPVPLTGTGETSSSSSIPFPYVFESQFGPLHPLFHASTFACALDLGRAERRPVFVYLHSLRHPDTAAFCSQTLCSEVVVQFLDANFVCWGAAATDEDDDVGEGVQMAAALGARGQFPFCVVVVPADGDNVVVLQEVQGAVSPSELVDALQRALEEASAFMVLASEEEDAERESRRLWETLDAQYWETVQMDNKKNGFRVIVIEVDDSTERCSSAEDALSKDSASKDADMLAVEIGSSARQWSNVPLAAAQRWDVASETTTPRRPNSARGHPDKEELTAGTAQRIARALSFSGSRRRPRSAPPPPGRNGNKDDSADQPITQILIRFPNGQAREHAFLKTDKIRDVFSFVDSLTLPPAAGTEGGYRLISGFPRKVYGHDQLDTSLVDAGLHPRATLLLEQLN